MLNLNLTPEQEKKEANISFIGLGNMGKAIARAISYHNTTGESNISLGLFDTNQSSLKKVESYLNAEGTKTFSYKSIGELTKNSAIVLICVKPQILSKIYEEIREGSKESTCFISIAAGVSLFTLSNNLVSNNMVRFMPNIAAKARKAVTAVAACKSCSKQHLQNSMEIANAIGTGFQLPEEKFSAFIGISGSAIAYIFEFAHALAMGGTREGIAYDEAAEIAFSTMESACALYASDKQSPINLATKVCSAGGTTIEGMKSLSEGAFDNTVINAVSSAAKKSRDLERE